MAEPQAGKAAGFGSAHSPGEGLHEAGAGAPGDVKAGHRVAMADGLIAAALGPADHRKEAYAEGMEPGALLTRREGDVGLGPPARPVVFGAVKSGSEHPILQGEVQG